jgi:hypothetical protein
MSEEASVPPIGDNTQAPVEQPKFAGKFNDAEALATGINHLRTRIGAEPLARVIGEDGTYRDAGEAERAYKELERLAGSLKPKVPDGKPTDPLKISDPINEEADVTKILSKAGLDQVELEKSWIEKGDFTEAQYEAILKARPTLTKGDVKLIAQGMAAQAVIKNQTVQAAIMEAENVVGGKDQLQNLLASAATFVTDKAELADFNRRLSDPKLTAGAVRDLAARHAAEVGAGRSTPIVRGSSPAGPVVPKSSAEFTAIVKRAAQGDANARAILMATPQSVIDSWKVVVH